MSDMDTKKALIVIMILLIIMNVALASYIIVINTGRDKGRDNNDYVVDILRQRNIEVGCKIPEEGPGASSLNLGDMLYNENSFDSLMAVTGGSYTIDSGGRLIFSNSPDDNVAPTEMNRTAVEGFAHDFMTSIGLQIDDFILDYILETGTDEYDISYIEKDKSGTLYYDSYIEMKITEYGVMHAEIYIRTIRDKGETDAGNLPIQTIMLANLTMETKTVTIKSISFGYHQKGRDSDKAIMSWRIRFNDGSERFFAVDNGQEIMPVLEILEFNNIVFNCTLPQIFDFKSPVIYGESIFTIEALNSMPVFMNGKAEIDSNGIINYVRTSFDDTRYNLNEETVAQISESFISDIGLSVREYYLNRMITADDGSYDAYYVMTDSDGALYFDNFINLNIKEQGLTYVSFRHNVVGVGLDQTIPMAVGTILLDNLDTENGQEYVVNEITAGYKKDSLTSADAIPCWRVIFENNVVRYFSAVDGNELALDED